MGSDSLPSDPWLPPKNCRSQGQVYVCAAVCLQLKSESGLPRAARAAILRVTGRARDCGALVALVSLGLWGAEALRLWLLKGEGRVLHTLLSRSAAQAGLEGFGGCWIVSGLEESGGM